jgi:hypothetical protein
LLTQPFVRAAFVCELTHGGFIFYPFPPQKQLATIAEQVSVITETTAQAVFMVAEHTPGCKKATPGLFDPLVVVFGFLCVCVCVLLFFYKSVNKKIAVSGIC